MAKLKADAPIDETKQYNVTMQETITLPPIPVILLRGKMVILSGAALNAVLAISATAVSSYFPV